MPKMHKVVKRRVPKTPRRNNRNVVGVSAKREPDNTRNSRKKKKR